MVNKHHQAIFFDFTSLGIYEVKSFFSFEVKFDASNLEEFWALSGYDSNEQQTNLYIFRVETA